jgi:hypothetical protein
VGNNIYKINCTEKKIFQKEKKKKKKKHFAVNENQTGW